MGCLAALAAVATLTLGACGDDESDAQADSPTTAERSTTTTSAAPTTTSPPTTASPSTTGPATPAPGSRCALGTAPDCIDPDGDGQGTYLIGGAECIASFPDSPGLCDDLEGDGH